MDRFKTNLLVVLLGLFWAFFASNANAVTVNGLYQVTLSVPSQSTMDRNIAVTNGLKEVFYKVTGEVGLDLIPEIEQALKNPDPFVLKYSYIDSSTLTIYFSKNGVDDLLSRVGLKRWGSQRPLVMVWMAMVNGQGQLEIASGKSPQSQFLKKIADRSALPLVFPLMDLSDIRRVSFQDIWLGNTSVLTEDAKRYGAQYLLLGKIMEKSGKYVSLWRLAGLGPSVSWSISADDLPTLLKKSIHEVTENLARRYAESTHQNVGSTTFVTIGGVANIRDHAKVVNTLKSLQSVMGVALVRMEKNVLIFQVALKDSITDFQNEIEKKGILKPYQLGLSSEPLSPLSSEPNTFNAESIILDNPEMQTAKISSTSQKLPAKRSELIYQLVS